MKHLLFAFILLNTLIPVAIAGSANWNFDYDFPSLTNLLSNPSPNTVLNGINSNSIRYYNNYIQVTPQNFQV